MGIIWVLIIIAAIIIFYIKYSKKDLKSAEIKKDLLSISDPSNPYLRPGRTHETTKADDFIKAHEGDYKNYIRSPEWKIIRNAILEEADYKCMHCGKVATTAHHTTYSRLGRENRSDLVALCQSCHRECHRNSRFRQMIKRGG